MLVKTGTEEFQNYLTDASNMAGGHALKLFLPETAEDVAAILRDADEQKMPVTVSGARTGTVGGAIPFGGFVISMERMNKIIGVDKNAGTATVQPGVILGDLQKAVDADGLFYPPDPTEWSCQIGGTVATNASGSRSFKYGATRNFVERLKVVLADGDMIDLRRGEIKADESGMLVLTTLDGRKIQVKVPTYKRPQVRKNVSGYFAEPAMDAIDLFIGSEGTLGVIVEIELSLLSKPRGFFSGIVFFETHGALLEFVDEARDLSFAARRNPAPAASGSDLRPAPDASLIEYFDDRALKFISEKFPEVPPEMAGAIYFEQETNEGSEDALLEAWNALLERHNADLESSWFTTTDADNEKMREFRHALPVSVNERIVRSGQRKVGTDMSVPDDNFLDFLRLYKRVLNESGLDHVIFGHIGDCHLHANILPKNDDEATRARHLYGRFVADAIMLGGTVSAEHGIGKLKRKYLNVMMGERYLSEMAAVKKAFDPKGILGRGNMFDEKFLG